MDGGQTPVNMAQSSHGKHCTNHQPVLQITNVRISWQGMQSGNCTVRHCLGWQREMRLILQNKNIPEHRALCCQWSDPAHDRPTGWVSSILWLLQTFIRRPTFFPLYSQQNISVFQKPADLFPIGFHQVINFVSICWRILHDFISKFILFQICKTWGVQCVMREDMTFLYKVKRPIILPNFPHQGLNSISQRVKRGLRGLNSMFWLPTIFFTQHENILYVSKEKKCTEIWKYFQNCSGDTSSKGTPSKKVGKIKMHNYFL